MCEKETGETGQMDYTSPLLHVSREQRFSATFSQSTGPSVGTTTFSQPTWPFAGATFFYSRGSRWYYHLLPVHRASHRCKIYFSLRGNTTTCLVDPIILVSVVN